MNRTIFCAALLAAFCLAILGCDTTGPGLEEAREEEPLQQTTLAEKAGKPEYPPGKVGTIVIDQTPDVLAGAEWILVGIAGSLTGSGDIELELPAGEYTLSWAYVPGYCLPDSETLICHPREPVTFDGTYVEQSTTKIVLLEGFSNVCSYECPSMNSALHEFMATEGYGTNRVLLIKYATDFPAPFDPHYLANPADNDARAWGPNYDMTGYYADMITSIPTLIGDGALLGSSGSPPTAAELGPLVDAMLEKDPGFTIQVVSTIDGTSVTATITLGTEVVVDLTGLTLNAALVENPIVYDEPPCEYLGELEFQWIMRDFEIITTSLASPSEGSPVVETVTLTRNLAWPSENLYVVAFVQSGTSREVLQAGSDVPAVAE